MSLNSIHLLATITRDPELRYSPTGKAVLNFDVAFNHKWTTDAGEKKDEASFFNVVAFGKTAETIAQYFKKGSQILIDGSLKQERWTDKQTGQNRSSVKIRCEKFSFVGKNPSGETQGQARDERPARSEKPPAAAQTDDLPPEEEDDFPF